MSPPVLWRPHPGPQTQFLASTASEVCYGGAAGGGKSAASVALPLRWVHNPGFHALFLRREAKYLSDALKKSEQIYRAFGATLVRSPKIIWTFPSGATVWLNHCEHESDVANYDSLEFSLVIFEELTHFTENQYRGIRARIRGTDPGLPRYSRATTNPGGEGHEWVFRRFAPWLDPESPVKAKPAEKLYYRGEEIVARGTPDALSRTFIPARLTDNPSVTSEYRAQLLDMDPVRREQLLNGDWLIKPAAGAYFKRAWFQFVDAAPLQGKRIRYWDRAATESTGKNDPDWTVGLKLHMAPDKTLCVEDVIRIRANPGDVEKTIRATAEIDGRDCMVGIEQDPGQAGKFEAAYYVKALQGWNVHTYPVTKAKDVRAGPVSAQVSAGNVRIVRAPWNEALIRELEEFPEGSHDDQVDALSGAFAALTTTGIVNLETWVV